MTTQPAAARRVTFIAAATWLATLAIGLAILWVGFQTNFLELGDAPPSSDFILTVRLAMIAIVATTLGYASVGALLAGRQGAGRIGAILLLGGALFALVPFGYMVGGFLSVEQADNDLYQLLLLVGPVALGPGVVAILPALALGFPDGRLPSPRWRWPVAILTTLVGMGTLVQLVNPAAVGGPSARNPLGIDALPPEAGLFAYVAVGIGIMGFTALGIAAVVVRYRRGTEVERQQTRWFLAAVLLAGLPLGLSFLPGLGGPASLLVATIGLMLVPIAVGIAVTRYRLYEIDRLINRTLVYVPLTAIVAGLYAGIVALLQRVFQSVTGDRSDAAIVISTLILASVFTPLRKWLEGIVDRRFKPAAHAELPIDGADAGVGGREWEDRVTAIALRVVRTELDARPPRKRAGGRDSFARESLRDVRERGSQRG